MVLLESISSDRKGRYTGYIVGGGNVQIVGVPIPKATGVHFEVNIKEKIDELKRKARDDDSKYYLIQRKECVLEQAKNDGQSKFSIGYTEFIR